MANSTLLAIQNKVRRLTRTPTEATLTDAEINEYINTFILYDFPEHLRLYNLRTTFTFYTQPNVDTYTSEDTDPTNTLYNFKNRVVAIHPNVYMAGIPGVFTQKRDIFYGLYPQFNYIFNQVATGDGTPGPFTGTLTSVPVLQNNVIFTTIDATNTALTLVDYPVSNSVGALGLPNIPQVLPSPYGQVNYITGAFTINFPSNTAAQAPITAETQPYQPGKPQVMLYYDQKFTIRPVPDKAYAIQLEADVRPTELIADTDVPQIEQWWQYIAYGAAKKVFEDRMDTDSVQQILPEYMKQENLVLRATLTIAANERTTTIYTIGKLWGSGWGWFGGIGWPY